jgi:hypothetical protein
MRPHPRPYAHPQLLTVALCLFLLLGSDLARVTAQLMPFAVGQTDGTLTIFTVNEIEGTVRPEIKGVRFLPIYLAGHAQRDRLLIDRPTHRGLGTSAPHVRLPQGGSLHFAFVGSETALIHISALGHARVLLSVPNVGSTPSLLRNIFVQADGLLAVVASTPAAGGNVLAVDLTGPYSTYDLTADEPPLTVHGASLRSSGGTVWFTAMGQLYRGTLTGSNTQVVNTNLPGAFVLHELALASSEDCVAAVVRFSLNSDESQDVIEDRHILVVDSSGPAKQITTLPGDYSTPDYANPRGPFLELSPDGDALAFRRTLETQELFLAFRDSTLPEVQITTEENYYNYIDSVGVLNFKDPGELQYFLGDSEISDVPPEVALAAGEMFSADLQSPAALVLSNVTLTSGQASPPYDKPGNLHFVQALFDPLGRSMMLVTRDAFPAQTYALDVIDLVDDVGQMTRQLSDLTSEPTFVPLDAHALVISTTLPDTGTKPRPEISIDLLTPTASGPPSWLHVVTVPKGIGMDRFTVNSSGTRAAFVVTLGDGLEIPVFINLQTGALDPALPKLQNVSPTVAFSGIDRLYLGLGNQSWMLTFGSFVAPSSGAAIAIPPGFGFPLQF